MKREIAIGVDIGGSHISCAAIDLSTKQYLEYTFAENELDNHAHSDVIIGIWGDTIKKTIELAKGENIAGIGFAMPGPFDYEKGISLFTLTGQTGKYENTYGLDVPAELRKYLDLPESFRIRFINDASAFAIGEDQAGKAKDFDRSLSVTLGTGFGSAFIKNGLPVVDGEKVPKYGCVWHLPFEGGIADDYFSTRGFIDRFHKRSGKEVSGVKDIVDQIDSDPIARSLFREFGEKMGMFLKPWIELFGMEAFVIGGNISRAYSLFGESLNDFLKKENLPLQVFVSELKETASFIGSATLIDDSYYERLKPVLNKMS
jgi:glucokinase